jgi:hypothetical protein
MNSSKTMVNEPGTTQAPTVEPKLELMGSRHFPAWLAEQNIGLAFTDLPPLTGSSRVV